MQRSGGMGCEQHCSALARQRSLAAPPCLVVHCWEEKKRGGQRIGIGRAFHGEASAGCLEIARNQGIGEMGRRRRQDGCQACEAGCQRAWKKNLNRSCIGGCRAHWSVALQAGVLRGERHGHLSAVGSGAAAAGCGTCKAGQGTGPLQITSGLANTATAPLGWRSAPRLH